MLRNRAGFSLAEVLVAISMTAVAGAATTGLLLTQSSSFDRNEKAGFARGVSRTALNVMMSELRMLEPGTSLEAASNTHVTVLAPYAMGVICGVSGGVTVSRLPTDPNALAQAGFTGYMHRQPDGTYRLVVPANAMENGNASVCTGNRIGVGTGGVVVDAAYSGSVVKFTSTPSPLPAVGAPVLFVQRVTYEFKESLMVPGTTGLFRRVHATGVESELVAPFDSAAGFRFYVLDGPSSQVTAPGSLGDVTGLELVLDGLSERPNRNGERQRVPLTTAIHFRNRR